MASDTHPQGDYPLDQQSPAGTPTKPAMAHPPPTHTLAPESPGHEFILNHQESQGFLVTSPLMSEASLADDPHQHVPAAAGAPGADTAMSLDSADYSSAYQRPEAHHSNGNASRTNSGSSSNSNSNSHSNLHTIASTSGSFRGHNQSSAAVLASGQYQLTVATFHKRNQDTNSFRTGQQFLIKLDLRSPPSEPLKSPMSLILPRRMIQGHQKARQPDTLSVDAASAASPANSTLEAAPPQAPDIPDALAGDPESHFYLEVTVHLASSEAIVQACPECCHKVDAKVRKPSNGPGAPSKAHGANDNVDPGQILQFCVSDHVVDFTHGTSTVMAKVLCSSTHHDKRGNNDRYFFKFSLMQYLGGQKIRVGSCRTKDILFTGNHKNKSMASFSEDKGDVKPRIPKPEDDASTGAPPSMVMGQSFYSEEPDSIHEDMHDRTHAHAHGSPHLPAGRSSHHQSFATYGSLRQHTDGHLPRIQEPTAMSMDSPRQRHHFTDKDTYDSASSRSPLSTQGTAARFTGQSPTDPKLVGHGGFAPVKSKSWNDTLVAPKITRIIPDVGDMLGGTEVTIFGSGFRAGLVPYFDSLPATNVTVLHSDVLTCRTPPRIHPVVASVGIRSKHSSNVSHSRTAPDAQFSYADKTGMVLAELVAEILVMGWDDYGEPRLHRSGTNLSASHNESGDRTEPRLGGLGDLRSRATRVVRRGSMRRDSSDISTQRSGSGGSRLNPMTESPRRRSTHSPLSHEQSLEDDEELERLVTEMMSISVTHSVVPTTQTSKALESAIMNIVRNGDELHHISMQNDQRHTMLHLAVLLEMNQLVDYLLKEKIEINAADWNGFTALHYAAWTGQVAMFEVLERHGASVEAMNCHSALPRHLFADSSSTPQEFAAMYHSRVDQLSEAHSVPPKPVSSSFDGYTSRSHNTSSNSSNSNGHSNLKDDIHEAYSRAKKARSSSGNMYVKSPSGDSGSQVQAPVEHHEAHLAPRQAMSTPSQRPSQQQQQQRQQLDRARPSSQSMHSQSPSQRGAPLRSPSPLREYATHYSQETGLGDSGSSGLRRYLHPVDVPPARTGSLPSIRLAPEHRDGPHQPGSAPYHNSSSFHHQHRPPSPSSPGSRMNGPPTSPMHRQHSASHPRYPSSPSSYDHPRDSPQQYEPIQEERRSDRMLPSFGLNLPVPYTYQEDGANRGPSPHSQSGAEVNENARHGSNQVGAGQKRSGSYQSTANDGPSNKAARTYESSVRPSGERHEYDLQGPALPIDNGSSSSSGSHRPLAPAGSSTMGPAGGASSSSSSSLTSSASELRPIHPAMSKDGNDVRESMDENGKPARRSGQASHTCPHPNCNKSFTRPFNLRAHMRVHTAERPYKCDTCALAFSRLHDRNRHAKLHTGIKPFECSYCHHQFIRPDALRRHLGRGGGLGCGQKAAYAAQILESQKQRAEAAGSGTNAASGGSDGGARTEPMDDSSASTDPAAQTAATTSAPAIMTAPSAMAMDQDGDKGMSSASRSSSGSSMRSTTSLSSVGSLPPMSKSASAGDWNRSSSKGLSLPAQEREEGAEEEGSSLPLSRVEEETVRGRRFESPSDMDEAEHQHHHQHQHQRHHQQHQQHQQNSQYLQNPYHPHHYQHHPQQGQERAKDVVEQIHEQARVPNIPAMEKAAEPRSASPLPDMAMEEVRNT